MRFTLPLHPSVPYSKEYVNPAAVIQSNALFLRPERELGRERVENNSAHAFIAKTRTNPPTWRLLSPPGTDPRRTKLLDGPPKSRGVRMSAVKCITGSIPAVVRHKRVVLQSHPLSTSDSGSGNAPADLASSLRRYIPKEILLETFRLNNSTSTAIISRTIVIPFI